MYIGIIAIFTGVFLVKMSIYGSMKLWYAILEKVGEYHPRRKEHCMPISKAQQKAVHKYVKANYDRLELTVAKGQKDVIKAHAQSRGESVNSFVLRAVSETMERDNRDE